MRIGIELLAASPFRWSELRDAAVSLEEVGFDSVWVPDHIEKEMNGETYSFFDAIALLGALADATTRIGIGASVHNTALRHPFRLAHAAVTLDEISGGRLVLGVGAGGGGYEHRYLGQPTGSRFPKFAESVEVLAGLLDGSEVNFDGKHWQLEGARLLGVGDRRIPLMLGAKGPKTIDLAFRWADEWNTFELADPRPESLQDRVELANVAEQVHQRDIRRSLDVMVSFDDSTSEGIPAIPAITGDPEKVADQLLAFAEIGFDEVHCYGPAPSQRGGEGWERVVEILHQHEPDTAGQV